MLADEWSSSDDVETAEGGTSYVEFVRHGVFESYTGRASQIQVVPQSILFKFDLVWYFFYSKKGGQFGPSALASLLELELYLGADVQQPIIMAPPVEQRWSGPRFMYRHNYVPAEKIYGDDFNCNLPSVTRDTIARA